MRSILLCAGIIVCMAAASGCCTYHGIKPVYPAVGHPSYHIAKVDNLQPTLKWETSKEPAATYDLRVMTSVDDKNYPFWRKIELKTVYHREKLTRSEHTIEEPLNPSQDYYWIVKESNVDNDGWSYYNYHLFTGFGYFYAHHLLYRFSTPDMDSDLARIDLPKSGE